MQASKENPVYTTYIVDGSTKYDITPTVTSLDFSDQEKQMAQGVKIKAMNVEVNGNWLTNIIKVRQRVFIYADDGEKNDEVFRGYIWKRDYKSSLDDREMTMQCYDQLIYLQESEESEYFSDGKSTKDVVAALCKKWSIELEYGYESITHSKLPLKGNLSDIFTSDILDLVKDRSGKKYVIRSEKDVLKILTVGQNSTVYNFVYGENAISTKSECTMEGMVTKVVILGKADDNDRRPVEATVSDKTAEYGTLQKIIDRDENTTLADSKKEAQNILKEGTKPKWEYELQATDVPWIRKGDKVYVAAGDIYMKTLIVKSVSRSIDARGCKMTLEMENP